MATKTKQVKQPTAKVKDYTYSDMEKIKADCEKAGESLYRVIRENIPKKYQDPLWVMAALLSRRGSMETLERLTKEAKTLVKNLKKSDGVSRLPGTAK